MKRRLPKPTPISAFAIGALIPAFDRTVRSDIFHGLPLVGSLAAQGFPFFLVGASVVSVLFVAGTDVYMAYRTEGPRSVFQSMFELGHPESRAALHHLVHRVFSYLCGVIASVAVFEAIGL